MIDTWGWMDYVGALADKAYRLEDRITGLEDYDREKTSRLLDRIASLEATVDRLIDRIDDLERWVDSLDDKVWELEG